jgi:glycosyltransferase involved in cell wall biosynthesis
MIARAPLVFHLGISSPLPYFSQTLAFSSVAAGIAPSQHTADTWRRDGWPQGTLHVVPNWVDQERFQPCSPQEKLAIRRALGLPEEAFLFVCIGRLKEDKGTGILLQAFASVATNDQAVALLLVGADQEGSTRCWEQQAGELGIPSRQIIFAGRQNDVAHYYRAGDAAIVPSIVLESFGLTVLEAMASGLPPIISDVGVMPEIVGPTDPSLVVPPGDPAALAERMQSMRRLHERSSELGQMLRQRAVTHFSRDRSVARYEEIMASAARIRATRGTENS